MPRIAIMQPYFVPYLGYFRLFSETDLLVALDCVQFPRRGWVHRNKLTAHDRVPRWLTLPLRPAPRDTKIVDLEFGETAAGWWDRERGRFRALSGAGADLAIELVGEPAVGGRVADFLVDQLSRITEELGISTPIVRSSTLPISPALRGQDRILEICRLLKAEVYVNAPGGRALYDEGTFRSRGIELSFLAPWSARPTSVLEALILGDRETLIHAIQVHGSSAWTSRSGIN
jgi:hypothetical protein